MKIKTAELAGPALDWAVAKCESPEGDYFRYAGERIYLRGALFHPSTAWHHGGPIIDRIAGLQLKAWLESKPDSKCEAHIHNYDGDWVAFGPTMLIAAMRCYCCAILGDEIDIPEELLQCQPPKN